MNAHPTKRLTATMLDGGRIVVPAEVRAALGLKKGDKVLVSLDPDGEVRLTTQIQALRRLQAKMRPFKRPGINETDDFIALRRAEAAREERGE
ncbi:MAG: AbrB/MazE/SpoVT family DNA-binding domain-containing protein [Sandarakinorhabdus sp.]